ncbi:F-box/kelch-repeat protein [Rosa sericea]
MATAEKVEDLPKLPSEIIRGILAWLPVKSLCRFRCVKKSWNSLILDPHFVKLHYDKAIEHEDVFYQRRRVFISDMWTLYSIDLDECLNRINLDDYSGNCVLVDNTYLQDFMGLVIHSNGLLFMRSCYHEFSFFNPAISQTKNLPIPPTYDTWSDEVCGFGFDLSTLDYKVVHGLFCQDELRFSVYSLKTGSWRVIQSGYPYKYRTPAMDGRLVDGGVHWLVRRVHDRSSMVIVSFVLAEEDVREIPLPPDFNIIEGEDEYYLSVFEECLCVGKKDDLEFWVMKEYGVAKSWTKISISLPFSEGLHSGFVKKNHHLLLLQDQMQQRLVMYNFDKKSFGNLSIRGIREPCSAGFYLESLVSPNNYSISQ